MTSVAEHYWEGCRAGELRYQWDSKAQRAVFYPRVVGPGTGASLEWRVSAGRGTVYSATVLRERGAKPRSLALIDLDEGFRMMSRIETDEPASIAIGDRVTVVFTAEDLPVFTLEER